jgi:hypothetical protein
MHGLLCPRTELSEGLDVLSEQSRVVLAEDVVPAELVDGVALENGPEARLQDITFVDYVTEQVWQRSATLLRCWQLWLSGILPHQLLLVPEPDLRTVALPNNRTANGSSRPARRRKGENSRAILALFEREPNAALTKQEIAEKVNLPFSSVQAVLDREDSGFVMEGSLWKRKKPGSQQGGGIGRLAQP